MDINDDYERSGGEAQPGTDATQSHEIDRPYRTDDEFSDVGDTGVSAEEVPRDRTFMDGDSARTPRYEKPPVADLMTSTNTKSWAAANMTHARSDNEPVPSPHPDYFGQIKAEQREEASRPETVYTTSTLSSPLHSAGASSSSLQSNGVLGISSTSADSSELFSRLVRVQSGLSAHSAHSRGAAGRHSSRQEKSSPSVPKTKLQNDGPTYPDQSFAALHRQAYTPPYQYFRAQSPFLSQGSQTSGSPNRSQEYLVMSPSARTGGNTPSESPGLFHSNVVRRGRFMEDDMESSQYKAPSLHPTHHVAPKESHSVRKEYDAISGHKLINEYEILSELGKGTHGKVKLARPTKSGQDGKVAIKIVKRFRQKSLRLGSRETQEDKVKKEIAVLKKARHHHVVSLLEVIDDPDWDKVYMVLEYVEEGEMKWRRKADKWTVAFERRRVEREREAHDRGKLPDINRELAEIDEFNAQVEWRINEKARVLSRQKQKAYENISSRRSSSATVFTDDEVQPREIAHNWSLEHGGDSETELPDIPIGRRMSRMALNSPNPDDLARRLGPYSQMAATRSADALFRDPFASGGSDPGSPSFSIIGAPLITPVFPEHVEKDKNFQRELKMIQRRDDMDNYTDEDDYYRHVPCLTLTRTRECFRDTILGLEYLHYQGIIHRDIKPANLLWTKDHRVKISDFGVSYLGRRVRSGKDGKTESDHHDDVELARTVGTPAFYAPELCDPDFFLEGKDNRRKIGPQMDIWALGVTLYCMVFARLPFYHENQIKLFEYIARQELFIPSKRLRAIRLNKRHEPEPRDRPEDILEYEEIGDELRDLLKKMLHKDPTQRITIQEIKRHPWVVKGMHNQAAWLQETDPANYIKDKTIKVTKEDVSAAIAPLTFVDRVRQLGIRVSSLVRGRDPNKRNSSRPGHSVSASSRSTGPEIQSRRSSLRGEDTYSSLRYRPDTSTSEHPLSQSQLASPNPDHGDGYFGNVGGITPGQQQRPGQGDRMASTTESVRTIRPLRRPQSRSDLLSHVTWENEGSADSDVSQIAMDDVPVSHPASITRMFGGTARSSAGLSSKRSSASMSSKSTSSDRLSAANFQDPHTLPLVGMSSTFASGRVELPTMLPPPVPANRAPTSSPQPNRPRARTTPRLPSGDAFARARYQNLHRERNDIVHEQGLQVERHAARSRPHSRTTTQQPYPLSPDDEISLARRQAQIQRMPTSAASSTTSTPSRPSFSRDNISAASSSDDVQAEATFSDNSRHPSMPSVVSSSSVTSVTGSIDDHMRAHAEKYGVGSRMTKEALMSTGETVTPATAKNIQALMQTAGSGEEKTLQGVTSEKTSGGSTREREDDDDVGYNGDHDGDDDSDDEGIVFGGFHR